MQTSGWLQLAIFVVALAVLTKPMGLYLMSVLDANGRTWFDPVLGPLDEQMKSPMEGMLPPLRPGKTGCRFRNSPSW